MVSFREAQKSSDPFILCQEKPIRKEIRGWFSNGRIDRDSVPKGSYVYDIREGEDGFATIEPFVVVNHGGTVVFNEQLVFPARGNEAQKQEYLELLSDDESNRDTAEADYGFSW